VKPEREAFYFEMDVSGIALYSGALGNSEIDWQIDALKNDLEALRSKMKTGTEGHGEWLIKGLEKNNTMRT
jgi:hypothetical protein